MRFDINPASDYPLPDLVEILNLGFEGYLIPIQLNFSQFLTMLRKDGIDLTTSRVLVADGQISGIALIARRGWTSRLAAMGIAQEMRGKGAGLWFMERLIQESRERQDREMVLEVIEQNDPGIQLYQKFGFQKVRRLIGLTRQRDTSEHTNRDAIHNLEEIDLREMGGLILRHGLPDLPWQLSGETITLLNPPARAYKKGQAYAAISDPKAEHVVVWSLLVERDARGNHLAADMLKSVINQHPDRIWHIPAITPEEFGGIFERAGFQREELSQWQMRLVLSQ
jgi:GNAT superfamily N-acetyltransferase